MRIIITYYYIFYVLPFLAFKLKNQHNLKKEIFQIINRTKNKEMCFFLHQCISIFEKKYIKIE
jgi:hypothetical protein